MEGKAGQHLREEAYSNTTNNRRDAQRKGQGELTTRKWGVSNGKKKTAEKKKPQNPPGRMRNPQCKSPPRMKTG